MTSNALPVNKKFFQDSFEAIEGSLNGAKGSKIHQLRKQGFESFLAMGFPSTRNEDWKYTDLTTVAKTEYKKSAPVKLTAQDVEKLFTKIDSASRIVLVNGRVDLSLSSKAFPKGVTLTSLSELMHSGKEAANSFGTTADLKSNPIVALNSSFFEDGVSIAVSKGAVIEEPIYLISLVGSSENTVVYDRLSITLEEGSSLSVVEVYLSIANNNYLSNSVSEITVEKNARLEHVKLGLHGDHGSHLGHAAVRMDRDSYYRSSCLTFGGKLVRNEILPTLNGENIECLLNGLTVIKDNQHVDNHTVLDHAKPHCHSKEIYKGIYKDSSSGVFSGTIIVRPDAQKTDAIQSNQSLLLSPTASIETRPQLKIWADDVKCTHGATVGQLDEEALFYLRARGVSKSDAQRMLIQAFAHEILGDFPVRAMVPVIESNLLRLL